MPEVTLADAAARFSGTLSPSAKGLAIAEVTRFIRWFGPERSPTLLRGHDIELYAEHLGPSAPETARKAEQVRNFLNFMKKEGIVASSLASHLRLRKATKGAAIGPSARKEDAIELTSEGIDALRNELDTLTAQRPAIREAIKLAMLDKDFRENSPLDAAKDKQGHVEARIREIETMLKRAVVVDSSQGAGKVRVGVTVMVTDLKDGAPKRFCIVGPTEANAADGKISSVSPVGKALLDHKVGEEVEVAAPRGQMRFRIEEITA
jgi:transcription elongation factor GreA